MSMMKVFATGRLYNGKKYTNLVEVPNSRDKVERSRFHGRLNYRDDRGDFHFVDVVCLNDFGDNGGLVGWLEREFSAPEDGSNRGGRAIEVFGYMRPTEREKEVEKKFRNGKGEIVAKMVKVPYTHWELVIQGASFATKDDEKWKPTEIADGDADDWDDVDDEDADDIMEEVDEDEEEETPPPTQRKKNGTGNKQQKSAVSADNKKQKNGAGTKKKQTVPADDEEEFFED